METIYQFLGFRKNTSISEPKHSEKKSCMKKIWDAVISSYINTPELNEWVRNFFKIWITSLAGNSTFESSVLKQEKELKTYKTVMATTWSLTPLYPVKLNLIRYN